LPDLGCVERRLMPDHVVAGVVRKRSLLPWTTRPVSGDWIPRLPFLNYEETSRERSVLGGGAWKRHPGDCKRSHDQSEEEQGDAKAPAHPLRVSDSGAPAHPGLH
jgi:hypothetical protein